MKRITLFLILGLLALGVLYLNRQGRMADLQLELSGLREEKVLLQRASVETGDLARTFSGGIDVASFTEQLYASARRAGISDHEVITGIVRAENRQAGGRQGRSRGRGEGLETSRLQVSLSGRFKDIAEYLRLVQGIESLARISSLEMKPGEKAVRAELLIDLYALEGNHAL
jgi:hypothetical protein